ncbi:MAG: homoserine dehydrogenase [Clostridia bacterium]|nr:homoserine dehydrogenase [Clostridia bacterium]MBQ4543181.1 homoserine dehydrogenase [Clostridia bacterium]
MVNVAVLGYGTVGSGVVEIINGGQFLKKAGDEINVKAILDIRKFPGDTYENLVTDNYDNILNDDEISIIVETMGGLKPAYDFTKRALLKGKSVVTSNKELVATHGAELLKIAKENNVSYLFEASVGGGIPIIRPLNNCLAANDITSILGILNGTTNYILTQMFKNGVSFDNALSDAQAKGYAEQNPAADIEGHDACRKIAILSSLAYGKHINSNEIKTEGITKISSADVNYAEEEGYSIKLIGRSKNLGDGVYACVSPVMLPKGHPLSDVEDVFNAILVNGSATGDVMFYGKGAGKLPTASAVVADVIDIVKHKGYGAPFWEDGGVTVAVNPDPVKKYVRVSDNGRGASAVTAIFGEVKMLKSESGEVVFITDYLTENEFDNNISKLQGILGQDSIINTITVL